jgi:hypothetical protein
MADAGGGGVARRAAAGAVSGMSGLKIAGVLATAAAVFLAPWHEPPFVASTVDVLLGAGCALIATGVLGTFGARS